MAHATLMCMVSRVGSWRSRGKELPDGSTPDGSRETLARGVLVFRWVWLLWMTFMAASNPEQFRYGALAWASVGAAGAWTVWLTVMREEWTRSILWFDILICGWLIAASGLVVPEGDVVSGRPFFATGYPLSAPLLWGAARGPWGGVAAGLLLGIGHLLSRPLNGVSLFDLSTAQYQNVFGAVLNYIVAGVAVGIVSRVLVRSAQRVEEASKKLMAEREAAARAAEREKIVRHIHDSVLQTLALVHKRGEELAAADTIPPEEVAKLSEMAAAQEAELRGFIMREPPTAPTGEVSLREALELTSRSVEGIGATVSSVGPIWMPQDRADELVAAVRQALENSARHAEASKIVVFADEEDGVVTVSVRDDGKGFTLDEQELRSRGKAGILKSMKGRVEDLGGTTSITTAPGRGTEVEFAVPKVKA